jgi:GNAT superfamily N-acetyltransferase
MKIHIIDFTAAHIEQATYVAKQNYEAERRVVHALPPVDTVPDLTPYAENGLGVAAFDGDKMLGFLCCTSPFRNAFRSTDATGVFSPMGANGTIIENRAEIYARLYQAVGEKWAQAGATSHAICLYAHDKYGQEQFFRYGFGLRCIDAIRPMNRITAPACADYNYCELTSDQFIQIIPLNHMLDAHMAASPTFMPRPPDTELSFMDKAIRNYCRYFAAKKDDKVIAFAGVAHGGETFACEMPGYTHISTGAYCLPEHRGKGVFQNLINFIISTLSIEGYTHFGVDFESINPNAYGFWLKYFTAYTHSVVRRIDERAILEL